MGVLNKKQKLTQALNFNWVADNATLTRTSIRKVEHNFLGKVVIRFSGDIVSPSACCLHDMHCDNTYIVPSSSYT